MGQWILYLHDYGPSASTITATSVTNGARSCRGFDNGIAVVSASTSYIDITFPSACSIGAIGFANHNLTSSVGVNLYYYSGGFSQYGTTKNLTGYVDEVLDWGAAGSYARWKIDINTANGMKIGGISFLSYLSYHKLTLTNTEPKYPIGNALGAMVARQSTATGEIIGQRHGGAFMDLDLEIPLVQLRSTTANTEGWLDDAFLRETHPTTGVAMLSQGFPNAIWVKDDNGDFHHCTVRGISAPVTHFGGRATVTLSLRTIPHVGLI